MRPVLRSLAPLTFPLVVWGCSIKTISHCPDGLDRTDVDCSWRYCKEHPREPACLELADAGFWGDAGVPWPEDASIDASCGDCTEGGTGGPCNGAADCTDPRFSVCGPEGRCVECTTADHDACTGDTSYCGDNNRCVECLDDEHCPATDPICASGSCSSCSSTADCTSRAATPICDTGGGGCVECDASDSSVCTAAGKVCLEQGTECVGCNVDADCANPGMARCNTTQHECVPCEGNAECSHVNGKNVCAEGACVECTPATEAADCGDKACDPDTFECTDTNRGSLASCRPCRSDSECIADRKCVRVPFMGNQGEYHCMQAFTPGACLRPFGTATITAVSKNGAPAAQYCVHDTGSTTCEAINALNADTDCTAANVGEKCGQAGRCEMRLGILKCTYSCSGDAFCPSGYPCNEESSATPYCGGT